MSKLHICLVFSLLLIISACWQYEDDIREHRCTGRIRALCARMLGNLTESPEMDAIRKTCADLPFNLTQAVNFSYLNKY